jgi:hypothetical protein
VDQEVLLSDGEPCNVRVLGLFELDDLGLAGEPAGPFVEKIDIGGKTIEREYIPPTIPPEEPKVSRDEAEKGTPDWENWLEYDLYQEYIAHKKEEARIMSQYTEDVGKYIIDECITPEDKRRVMDQDDVRMVRWAALSARLRKEDISAALANTFPRAVRETGHHNSNGDAV